VPARSQDAATRIDQLEEQVRQLTGQVEELKFVVKQMRRQTSAPVQANATELAPLAPLAKTKLIADQAPISDGIETIEETPLQLQEANSAQLRKNQQESIYGGEAEVQGGLAPGPTTLGRARNQAASQNDGGFQGQILVEPRVENLADTGQASSDGEVSAQGGIEQVALAEDTPENLYRMSDEALLRRQFGSAESGFKKFLQLYPDHKYAGSAQYWLGETYFAQGDYRTAAQNYLLGYQKYSKSRRAPDSLLKLGMALNRLGQKSQACVALGNVGNEYPGAVESKKRAQAEAKRAGC
jgi:tol-pal system protein YbgF